jgi:hypothetical protein
MMLSDVSVSKGDLLYTRAGVSGRGTNTKDIAVPGFQAAHFVVLISKAYQMEE